MAGAGADDRQPRGRMPLAAGRGLGRLLDLLFPPRCAGCGHWDARLCQACLARLEPILPPFCQRCGEPRRAPGVCGACRVRPPAFDRAWTAYRYAEPLRTAIHRFKYGGERGFAGLLGQLLADAVHTAGLDCDLIVPVPLHRTRQRRRGYNQSALLAQAVAMSTGRLVAEGLVRLRPTPPQVGRSLEERRRNVAGAFAWSGPPIAGRRVLLIDDVCTTGATLDACAQALRPHRPATIVAAALARG